MLEDIQEAQSITVVLDRLRESLSQPYQLGDEVYDLSLSFGAAVCNEKFRGAEEVLVTAEQALEWAISSGQAAVYVLADTPEVLA